MGLDTVEIKVYGRFRQFANRPQFEFEIHKGDTVQMLIDKLGLPGSAPDLWVMVNHIPAERDRPLQPGESITFFQPVAGG